MDFFDDRIILPHLRARAASFVRRFDYQRLYAGPRISRWCRRRLCRMMRAYYHEQPTVFRWATSCWASSCYSVYRLHNMWFQVRRRMRLLEAERQRAAARDGRVSVAGRPVAESVVRMMCGEK